MILQYIIILILLLILIKYNVPDTFINNTFFSVIVTTYNPGLNYLDKCLNSILNQNYTNYTVCILDDASNKEPKKIRNLIKKYCNKTNWGYVFLNQNVGPLVGRIAAIEKLNPNNEDVIISIDGDDELYNNNIFSILNNFYKQSNILMTFGNYVDQYDNNRISKSKINCNNYDFNSIIKKNSFRHSKWIYSHLKTFKYKLYKKRWKIHKICN